MKYRQLGNSDLQVSEISLGGMSLGQDYEHLCHLVDTALDQGINFIDTADLYDQGENETLLGRCLKGRRDQVILATKVGNQWREDGSGWDWNPRKSYILSAIDKSLERLQTDYLDLYQLHGGTWEDPYEEVMEAFERLQAQGKIRYYGISSIRPNVIRRFAQHTEITSVMIQYSLLDRRPEEETLELLHSHNIGVLVRGAVAKGHLLHKTPLKPYLGHPIESIRDTQQYLTQFEQRGYPPQNLAIRYVLDHPAVSTVVAGVSKEIQLLQNVQAGLGPPLPKEIRQQLQTQIPAKYYTAHR